MNISKKTLTAGIVVIAIAGASAVGLANHKNHNHRDHDSADLIRESAISIDQAMEIALADVPGKVMEAEIDREDGVVVWEIEVVDNQNQIFEFEIDANSGNILEKELDDH
ncbi:MAG: PepSY domain-containing protein [bacterium]